MIRLLNEHLKGLDLFNLFKEIEPAVYNSKTVKALAQKVSEDNAREMLTPGILMAEDVLKSLVIFSVDRQIRISPIDRYHQMWGSHLEDGMADISICGSYKFEWTPDERRGKYYWGKIVGKEPNSKKDLERIIVEDFRRRGWYRKYKLKDLGDYWQFSLNKESNSNDDFNYIAEYSFIVDISKYSPGSAEISFCLEFSLDWDKIS